MNMNTHMLLFLVFVDTITEINFKIISAAS